MRGNVESDDEIVYQSDDQTTDETTVSETGSSSENSESDSSEQDNSQTVTRFKSKATNSEPSNTSDNLASGESNDYDSESEETEDNEEEQHSSMYQKILTHKVNNDETYFFVKVTGQSYRKCIWITKEELISTKSGTTLFNRYWRKYQNSPPQEPYYDPEYEKPEKIITQRVNENGNTEYLVKWKNLDYDMLTWENQNELGNNDLINNFIEMENNVPNEQESNIHPDPSEYCKIKNHQKSKHGLEVRYYQLDGLNFLVKNWFENRNVILADEMGLGKTLQSTLLLNYLSENQGIHGPFLVIAPLSTLPHWEREIKEWTNLTTLTFCGTQIKRKIQKKYEFFYQNTSIPKFNVLITTYEYIIREEQFLSKINWKVMIIDETHRLKNHKSKILNSIKLFDQVEFKLLITGTPLQNNIEELWTLLNLLDPNKFDSIDDFKERFGDLSEADQVTELQDLIKPYMIRRRKNEVEKSLPPMEEIIIECPMTQHQKAYYKNIYNKNLEYLSRGAHKTNMANLNNISMELRKVCNHPYLINGAEEQILVERCAMMNYDKDKIEDYEFVNQSLIRSAGKMILLDKLLNKLKKDGHRVLIFSQMKKVLDILQDYLTYKEYGFERIDGGIRGEERQKAIDRFNEPDSKDFVFLLCTKAGGVGINLTSADTVIIYDSDWNPQNDIQATARCHRIGQTKEVKMYRFITSKSYEKKMFDRASMKLGLDHAVLESKSSKSNNEDLEKILRLGAYFAFEEDDDATEKFGEKDIDELISNSKKIRHDSLISDGSKFSVTQFEIDESDSQVDLAAPDFWQKYLPQVVEDDVSSGGSIADRIKMMHGEAVHENHYIPDKSVQKWSKQEVIELQKSFFKFGWGRWHTILENTNLNVPLSDIKHLCQIILQWLIGVEGANSNNNNSIIESIYNQSITSEFQEFSKMFNRKYKRDFYHIIVTGYSWKISRLNILYFINSYVSTCPNPPDDIYIPITTSQKPAEWWTEDDDRDLIYGTWRYGYQDPKIIFSNPSNDIPLQLLSNRLKSLINGLKTTFMKCQEKAGQNIPFNYETIRLAQDEWKKKDHKIVVNYLMSFGFPNPSAFNKVAKIQNKSDEQIKNYVNRCIEYCNKVVNGDSNIQGMNIAEPIKPQTASRLLKRIDLFERVRKQIEEKKRHNDEDLYLLKYVAQNGFIGLDEQKEIVRRFGLEGFESKVVIKLKKLTQHTNNNNPIPIEHINPKERKNTLHAFELPKYETNEDGSPKLPIQIGQSLILISLGKIVPDKPKFFTERYIYTDGFISEHRFPSLLDPNEKTWYRSRIIDKGDDIPYFRVELKDDPSIYFEGNVPSNPWVMLVKAIEKKKKKMGIKSTRSLTISGPEYYGLSSTLVIHLLEDLENEYNTNRNENKSLTEKKKNPSHSSSDSEQISTPIIEYEQNEEIKKVSRRKVQLTLDFTKAFEMIKEPKFTVNNEKTVIKNNIQIQENPTIQKAIKKMIPKIFSKIQ